MVLCKSCSTSCSFLVRSHSRSHGTLLTKERRGRAIPILPTGDGWDRNVDYKPPKGPYDPRQFLAGCFEDVEGSQTWKSGVLDQGSFFETMGECYALCR
jgi:hypothetical protein